jgi:hypothetical protein
MNRKKKLEGFVKKKPVQFLPCIGGIMLNKKQRKERAATAGRSGVGACKVRGDSQYYRNIQARRKVHGREKPKITKNEPLLQ